MFKHVITIFLIAFLLFAVASFALPNEHNITISIEMSINGSESGEQGMRYSCINDASVSGDPFFSLIFAGTKFVSSGFFGNIIELTQESKGNKFLIAATGGGCNTVRARAGDINEMVSDPYAGFIEHRFPTEMILKYTGMDIVGNFFRSGVFSLNLKKSATDDLQIIVT
jgi:hypothetical protein